MWCISNVWNYYKWCPSLISTHISINCNYYVFPVFCSQYNIIRFRRRLCKTKDFTCIWSLSALNIIYATYKNLMIDTYICDPVKDHPSIKNIVNELVCMYSGKNRLLSILTICLNYILRYRYGCLKTMNIFISDLSCV